MPPRSSIRKKPNSRKSSSSSSESSPIVSVRYIRSSIKKVKSSPSSETTNKKKTVRRSSKKKTVKSPSSSETPVKTSNRKKIIDSSSSSSPIRKPIKSSTKKVSSSSYSGIKTNKESGKKKIDSSSSSSSPIKKKTIPRARKILSSSSSSDEEPTVKAIRSLTNKKKFSSSEIETKSQIKKETSDDKITPISNIAKSKNGQEEYYGDSSINSHLNKILPSDLANIVYGLAKEFRGETKIFGNHEKTNRMLLDNDNIIFILKDRIRAHNLNNFNVLFDVEHSYNITYFYGVFRIKNYIVLLVRSSKSFTVGIHNPKNGTKIKSKNLDDVGEIEDLTGTSENIILNVKGKLFILNPFDDEKLITVETEDIQYESSLIRWEKGFYTFQNNTIYIFDTNKLIKKFTTDSYLTRVTTDGNIFYWNTTDYSTGDYLTIYDTTNSNENYKVFYQGTLSGSRKSFTVKNNKIFYWGTYIENYWQDYSKHKYITTLDCLDLETKENISIFKDYSFRDTEINFVIIIDNKVIFKYGDVLIYDMETRKTSSEYLFEYIYLGTTLTDKVVFRNKEGYLAVLS